MSKEFGSKADMLSSKFNEVRPPAAPPAAAPRAPPRRAPRPGGPARVRHAIARG